MIENGHILKTEQKKVLSTVFRARKSRTALTPRGQTIVPNSKAAPSQDLVIPVLLLAVIKVSEDRRVGLALKCGKYDESLCTKSKTPKARWSKKCSA